ncbi:response regulator transcription factor [Ruegeria sp. EL01]|jgi:two-component system OmpR family response regulator|uniref:response regulator transcription factor n=1 Tax=Ruegeria sp. EL01 TaxID=2107578 RepID=UPI000EA801E2|nr:response regulator transcription factor [Ruegeria sp. EL01]
MANHILIVDDDARIRDVVRFALEDSGFQTTEAATGLDALERYSDHPADLIVLDIGMPDMDGLDTCRELRRTSSVPVLFLTARDEEIDRILGFQTGGDDYVTKPFSPRELVLRIKAILARAAAPTQKDTATVYQDLRLDETAHRCTLADAEVQLTGIEFAVLSILAKSPDRVFSRSQLIELVYGQNTYLSGRTVDSHIRNIRQKARILGYPDLIQTVHGVGVKLGDCQC